MHLTDNGETAADAFYREIGMTLLQMYLTVRL